MQQFGDICKKIPQVITGTPQKTSSPIKVASPSPILKKHELQLDDTVVEAPRFNEQEKIKNANFPQREGLQSQTKLSSSDSDEYRLDPPLKYTPSYSLQNKGKISPKELDQELDKVRDLQIGPSQEETITETPRRGEMAPEPTSLPHMTEAPNKTGTYYEKYGARPRGSPPQNQDLPVSPGNALRKRLLDLNAEKLAAKGATPPGAPALNQPFADNQGDLTQLPPGFERSQKMKRTPVKAPFPQTSRPEIPPELKLPQNQKPLDPSPEPKTVGLGPKAQTKSEEIQEAQKAKTQEEEAAFGRSKKMARTPDQKPEVRKSGRDRKPKQQFGGNSAWKM